MKGWGIDIFLTFFRGC